MTKNKIEALLEPYAALPLECDGLARVASWVLMENEVPHVVFHGRLEYNKETVEPHFWIETDKGQLIDYRARMWLGEDNKEVPHGVFRLKSFPKALYIGEPSPAFTVNRAIFNILTTKARF